MNPCEKCGTPFESNTVSPYCITCRKPAPVDRITRDQMCMEWAQTAAKRSTCQRLQVGAIIALNGRPLSSGYNGAPRGHTHCAEWGCDLAAPCTRTVHAEANAIAFAARHGIAIAGAQMYCTHSPCNECAKLIINAGISLLYFGECYRDESPILLLRKSGVQVKFRASFSADFKAFYGSTGQ